MKLFDLKNHYGDLIATMAYETIPQKPSKRIRVLYKDIFICMFWVQ